MSTRILLVDDHRMFLDGLRHMLKQRPELAVVGEAEDGATAIELVGRLKPDLVLLDLQLPDCSGIQVCQRMLSLFPTLKIIFVSAVSDPSFVSDALCSGASGYILKTSTADELIHAIQAVLNGKVFLCPEVATVVVKDYRKLLDAREGASKPHLSERELEVLRLTTEGRRTKEIADQLQLSVKSVETYRARLMAKLHCSGTAELTRYAIREGVIAP